MQSITEAKPSVSKLLARPERAGLRLGEKRRVRCSVVPDGPVATLDDLVRENGPASRPPKHEGAALETATP